MIAASRAHTASFTTQADVEGLCLTASLSDPDTAIRLSPWCQPNLIAGHGAISSELRVGFEGAQADWGRSWGGCRLGVWFGWSVTGKFGVQGWLVQVGQDLQAYLMVWGGFWLNFWGQQNYGWASSGLGRVLYGMLRVYLKHMSGMWRKHLQA